MRFMILGTGMQGRACAFDMLRNPEVQEILLCDSSEARLEALREEFGDPRVQTSLADAKDVRRVRELAADRDVLVSAVPYYLNLPLARAAVDARTSFVDLGGNTDLVWKELALHEEAVRAGITLQPDVGLGPGMINTIAAHGIAMMEQVDEVLIRDGGLPLNPEPPMGYMLTFSEHGLINEYVEDATALRDFKRVAVPGLSEVEVLDLPAPLGRCEAAHASGGLSTMAWTYEGKVRTMDNKLIRYPGHISVINAMKAMGFFDTEPLALGGLELAPRDLSAALFRKHFHKPQGRDIVVIRVTVRGIRHGRRAEAVYEMLDFHDEKTGMTAMSRTTGFPASIVAQLIARGEMRPGAHPIELGVPAELFLQEARRRGLEVQWALRFLEGSHELAVASE